MNTGLSSRDEGFSSVRLSILPRQRQPKRHQSVPFRLPALF